jgi:hypothetical protein
VIAEARKDKKMKASKQTTIMLKRISEKLFGKDYILLTHAEMLKTVSMLKRATLIHKARLEHNFS